jgi:membrane dipeptidase
MAFSQIDYICQMAGDAAHVGLGSDYDGGIGLQTVPAEIDTIADLQKLVSLLLERGYTEEDAAAVMGRNWLTALRRILA